MFRLTRSSEFSRCWVIVSPGCSEKNISPPVTREVTATHALLIGAPHVCPSFVSFPFVIAYVSVNSSLVIEMRVYFVSSGLKNTGWAPIHSEWVAVTSLVTGGTVFFPEHPGETITQQRENSLLRVSLNI